jgi:hypothetical protein
MKARSLRAPASAAKDGKSLPTIKTSMLETLMKSSALKRSVAACVLAIVPCLAGAGGISYLATDLPDAVLGVDLWTYSYLVDEGFSLFDSFNVFFDPATVRLLQDPPAPVNAGWVVSVLQPDAALVSDGIHSAVALVASPSLQDAFTVQFVWRRQGAPGAQQYELLDPDFNPAAAG